MKRYILFGDKIQSPKDGDIHYISPVKLVYLYDLDPNECILIPDEYDSSALRGMRESDYICLYPRAHGDYIEHLQKIKSRTTPVP